MIKVTLQKCTGVCNTLKLGVTKHLATAIDDAVRGPVIPIDVRSSEMLGVNRNGTGRLPSSSPV
jgi:hypothetical protein